MGLHVVLVHGTGAAGASWTHPDTSTLCRHLETAFGDDISFSRVTWSGRNTYQARVDGARKIRDEVEGPAGAGRQIILIGHSHGGSVIAYALAADATLCRKVAGVVFLATPFVDARPLPLGKHLPKGPALVAGLLCGMALVLGGVVLLSLTGWPDESSRALDMLAFALPYAGLLAWWMVFRWVGRVMGVSEGRVTQRTHDRLRALVTQLDLSALERRDINRRALIIRSTADEAASGLATAQFTGRLVSDMPSVVWLLPHRVWAKLAARTGFDRGQPPTWLAWTFFSILLAVLLAFAIRAAAWLSAWPLLQRVDQQIGTVGSWASDAGVAAFAWSVTIILLALAVTVPLVAIALPFKLAGLWLYGLRGWPLFEALYLELSVEPAPPGEWRIHQLDAKLHEWEVERARQVQLQVELAALAGSDPAEIGQAARALFSEGSAATATPDEATLAHSYVYDDPRAHRAIEEWLKTRATQSC